MNFQKLIMKAGNNVFLDTNIVIDIFKNKEGLKGKLPKTKFALSVIVAAELLFGAENSSNTARHKEEVERFIKACSIFDITLQTAEYYSKIKSQLRKAGNPIPENDIWIAAICVQNNGQLLTNDQHFFYIEGLNLSKME